MTKIERDGRPLAGIVLALALAGLGLGLTAGPPRLPPGLPDPELVGATLRGSSPPLEALGYLLTTLA